MKRLLSALFGAALLTASVATADAATTVYFENTGNWDEVYSYAWAPQDADPSVTPFTALPSTTIDGHKLYYRTLTDGQENILFLNKPNWEDKIQTKNLAAIDGAVYNAESAQIANIVEGKYVAIDEPIVPGVGDVYLRGSFYNDFDTSDEYKFTQNGDIYTLSGIILLKGTTFKIANANWSFNYGGNFTVNGLGEYTLYSGSNDNILVGEDLKNVTFTFDSANAKLTITEDGGDVTLNWFCAWDVKDGKGWQFGNLMEEQQGEPGIYKVVVETPDDNEENYFAIFMGVNNTDWSNAGTVRYTPKDQKDQVVDGDGTYEMQTGSNGAWKLNKKGQWTVVVNVSNQSKPTISFDYGDSTGEANILINDRTETGYDSKSYAMDALADTDDDDYTWSGEIGAQDEVMFNIHGVTYTYDPSIINSIEEDHGTGNLIIQYPLTEGETYVRFDYDIEVTYNVNVTDKTVTLIQKNAPEATINITKASGDTGIHRMNLVEGVTGGKSYATIHTITFEAGDCVDFRLGDKRYIPVFDEVSTQADATAVNFTLQEAPDDEPAPEWKGSDDATPVYVRINDNLTGVVQSDIPTAVKGIETEEAEAVYFNLQGIRVANPENGIFIVKKGGKTLKVVK